MYWQFLCYDQYQCQKYVNLWSTFIEFISCHFSPAPSHCPREIERLEESLVSNPVRVKLLSWIFNITWFRGNRIHADIRTPIKATHLISDAVVIVQARIFTLLCHFNDIWWWAGLFVERPLFDKMALKQVKIYVNTFHWQDREFST